MNEITLLLQNQSFERNDGIKVEGVTIIIDGHVKEIFDIIMTQNADYTSYDQVFRDVFTAGLNDFAKIYQK